MNPMGNGGDYYKKMLELQERLRRSEEERIRLEERFSLLEHESRSRHETCINRLRMRYIEFLEEQQARDERNHKLLGALDRVDSSLALISAKTDRLGALKKQYETSVLSAYNNRANGSITGDSGVASQNDERQRRSSIMPVGIRSKNYRSDPVDFGCEKSATPRSFSPIRSDPCYSNWSGIRYENSSISSARLPQSGIANNSCGSLSSRINTNPRSLLRTGCRIDREFPQSTPVDDYRFKSPRFSATEHSPRRAETTSYSSASRRVMRDLANTRAYDSYNAPSRSFNETSGYSRDTFQPNHRVSAVSSFPEPGKLHVSPNYSRSSKDGHILASNQTPYTKVTDILRRELGDEEEHIGNVVENELERYISKIRNLHREADPQSVEELDHEQNTSGDLLNVTLSDDGFDFSEEKHRALPQHLGNVLALAKDLANRTATSANNLANAYNQDVVDEHRGDGETGTGADERLFVVDSHTRRKHKDSPNASNEVYQLTSVNPLLSGTLEYEGHDVSNEKISLLAKNGISAEVAKASSELEARPRRNIEDVAKSVRNSQENHASTVESSIIDQNQEDHAGLKQFEEEKYEDAAGLKKLDDAYKIGEEQETRDYLADIVEDLEPWNLNALERRVQEIILNDEAQSDCIQKQPSMDKSNIEQDRQAISAIPDEFGQTDKNMNDDIVGDETNLLEEPVESLSEMNNEADPAEKLEQYIESPPIAEQSINQSLHEESQQQGIVPESFVESGDYGVAEAEKDYVQPEGGTYVQGEYLENSDGQFAYTADGQYQGDSNAQYENYDSSAQYQYDDQQYQPVYAEDPNGQQQYEQDPNQPYPEDAGQQPYVADANQKYPIDSNQQYPTETNYDQYAVDPNQEYSNDIDQQQYQQESYQADDGQAYPPATNDYVYPEGQEYVDTRVCEPNAQLQPEEQEASFPYDPQTNYDIDPSRGSAEDDRKNDLAESQDNLGELNIPQADEKSSTKKSKDVIKSILDSDTESTIEKNVSNTESDFDFN